MNKQPDMGKTFEIKKLLEIIDKMTQQNKGLKNKLREFEMSLQPRGLKEFSEKEKKDIYNEIHNKIDILNISIDKKHQESTENEAVTQGTKKSKGNSKNRFYR